MLEPLPSAPPARPPLALPARFRGRWRRDWRLRGELVGDGVATLMADGLWLSGRRTTPARSLAYLGLTLGLWGAVAAACGFVLLTSSGLAFRVGPGWLVLGPLIGLPTGWLLCWLPVAVLRRWLQPRVKVTVPWSAVERLASEGTFLEVVARLPSGVLWGRLRPAWFGRSGARVALRRLRDGGLDQAVGQVTTSRPRSVWVDRVVLAALLVGAGVAASRGLEGWRASHPATVAAAPSAAPVERTAQASRAAALASKRAMVPAGASAAEAIDGVSASGKAVWAAMAGEARTPDQQAEVDEGFLSVVPWDRVLAAVSVQGSLPRIEVLRQRLDGADPSETLGRRALFALAEAYLDRLPPSPGLWSARVEVAEAWLDVKGGTTWTLDGRAVRVPDAATAEIYNAIGRFLLADLARDVEGAVDAGDAPLLATLVVALQLEGHGLSLNLQPSSSTKALIAWGTGDFEYVLNRAWLKAQAAVRDEEAAVAAAKAAGYTLGPGSSSRDGAVRYADVKKDGRVIGWLGLFDPAKIRIDWGFASGATSTRGALLLTSGAYVTADGRPAGLAVAGGRVDNWLLDRSLGGMVVVGDGVHIYDLKGGVRLPGQRRLLRPLDQLSDLYALLDGVRRAEASGFQTHVLAANGKLTVSGDRASPELRERRLLITARYGKNPIVGVLDIPGAHRMSLHEAAVVAIATVEAPPSAGGPGLTVDGVANLDVGSYDILGVWTDDGVQERRGPVGLSEAKNLLRVSRRR